MKFFLFGYVFETRKQTTEEMVALLRKKYANNNAAFVNAVFTDEGLYDIYDMEEYFKRKVEICSKYNLDYEIPC